MVKKRLFWRLFALQLACILLTAYGVVWYVARVIAPLASRSATEPLLGRIAWGAALMAGLAGLASFWILRWRLHPLEDVRLGAERFARGDLHKRLPVDDTEEIGRLAEALNSMAAQLEIRITAGTRQRNEQEAILSSMSEGVIAVDNEERIISINRSAARILGLSNPDVHGRSIQEVIRNAQLQRFIAQALVGPSPVEGESVLRYGGERFLQVHAAVLADASERAIGAVVVLNDISRLRRLENIRTDFVANVSHELRTPLTSIKGFVETLIDGALDHPDDARRFLAVIARQVERLNAIIDDLLMLSRIEQDEETTIPLQPHTLVGILEEALQICTLKAEAKQIDMRLECPADLAAQMNPALIEQAVVNLIDNAVKYSDAQTAIDVVAGHADGDVFIKVSDRGCGIARHHLPRLFERFYRADKARSRSLGGTGLGLSIVKHIMQVHGGRVTVESAEGKGSTFTLYLPACGARRSAVDAEMDLPAAT